jgi:hypothetical protein
MPMFSHSPLELRHKRLEADYMVDIVRVLLHLPEARKG